MVPWGLSTVRRNRRGSSGSSPCGVNMRSSPKKWLMPAAIAGVLTFLVLVLVILGVFSLLIKRRAVSVGDLQVGWVDPVQQIERSQLSPATALLKLGGKDDITAINTALKEGDIESAYSLIVLSPQLSDEERIGSLLLVGKRYAAQGKADRAKLVYRQINLIAVLSPMLSDFSRADALLQSGESLTDLSAAGEAVAALNQARTLALDSMYLKPAHRKYLLDRLIPAYTELGFGREAWEKLEVSLELGGAAQLATALEAPEPVLNKFVSQDYLDSEVLAARTDRERRATVLADYLRDRGGKISSALVDDLATALMVEDARRKGTFEAGMLQASQLSDKIALMKDKVDWLTLKYAVALRAQGLSLVPAWEGQLGTIQSELAKARQDLYALYGDQIVTLPESSQVNRAWLELFRLELEMGRLGLYPNYPEAQLIAKMQEATQKLMAEGIDRSMRVDVVSAGEHPMFALVRSENYGKSVVP